MLEKKGFLPRDSAGRSIQISSKTKTGKITLVGSSVWNEISVSDYLEEVHAELFKEIPLMFAIQSTSSFYFSHLNDNSSQWTVTAGGVFVIQVSRQETFYIKGTNGQELELLIGLLEV